MDHLEETAERIHAHFEKVTAARDHALAQSRTLTRHCANAIRAVHREEWDLAGEHLAECRQIIAAMRMELADHPEIFYAGYTQDALKEYAEASLVYALVQNSNLPTPETLELEYATYLQGLAEAAGELRRRCLDCLLHGQASEAERLLDHMDDIYGVLVTMDYPDAITGGLRRLTDIVRGVTERTRGDLTLSLRQQQLEHSLASMEQRLKELGNE
jgi:translin